MLLMMDKAKPVERRGRKATGPRFLWEATEDFLRDPKIAGLPDQCSKWGSAVISHAVRSGFVSLWFLAFAVASVMVLFSLLPFRLNPDSFTAMAVAAVIIFGLLATFLVILNVLGLRRDGSI
jgi:hypothetical protein